MFDDDESKKIFIELSLEERNHQKILDLAKDRKVKAAVIGKTGGERIIISHRDKKLIDVPVDKALKAWRSAIPEIFAIK